MQMSDKLQFVRLFNKFVVRASGGSLYLGFRLITNFRLKESVGKKSWTPERE
jgi:hypothetical protein